MPTRAGVASGLAHQLMKDIKMKIAKILDEYRNDFSADMECEHCGHIAKLTTGYHDNFYHRRVIPAMSCKACGKNRAGELEHTDAEVSQCAV